MISRSARCVVPAEGNECREGGSGCPRQHHVRPGMELCFLKFLAVAGVFLCVNPATLAQDDPAPGDRWSEPANLASQELILGIDQVGDTIIAAGARGHVLFSRDQGMSWTQSKVPTRATLTGVNFVTPETGWVVGHDAIILSTRDGGETWSIQNFDPAAEMPFLDVWFADELHGIAIGAYGLMLATTDGGEEWEQVYFEPQEIEDADADAAEEGEVAWWESEVDGDYHLNDILVTADGSLYLAAEAGNIYRSDDRGQSWLTISPEYEGSFFGVIEAGQGRIIAVGLRGNLLYTDDRGLSWKPVELPVITTLNSGLRLHDGSILITGLGGTILISDDNGETFELHTQGNRKGVQTALQLVGGDVLLVGEAGIARVSLADLGRSGQH